MITVDPNLRGIGIAYWRMGVLIRAVYLTNPHKGRGYEAHVALGTSAALDAYQWRGPVIVEMPRVYPGMPKTDLNDLLDVAGVGAAVAQALHVCGPITTVFPSEWKGQLEKKAMLQRIGSKLQPQELERVQKTNKSDTEDILDAVGIGLWRLNRLTTKVYPGAIE